MKRRNLLLVLGGAGTGSLTLGTGAFSSASLDREVLVRVVDDDEAYLGLEWTADEVVYDTFTEVVTVYNQFTGELSLEVTSPTEGVTVDAPEKITTGESEPVAIKLESGDGGTGEDVTFDLQFVGSVDGTNVDKMRSRTVTPVTLYDDPVTPNPVSTVRFSGVGEVQIDTDASTPVQVRLTYADGSTGNWFTVESSEKTIEQEGGGDENTICAVDIAEFDDESETSDPGDGTPFHNEHRRCQ